MTVEASDEATTSVAAGRARLEFLFDTEFDAIYRFCLARSGDRVVADDVAADVFHAAARVLSSGSVEAVNRPWLFVVARNRLIDHWRRSESESRRVARFTAHREGRQQSVADPDPFDGSSDEVLRALASLPERQRTALVLRYVEEYSVSEIATQIDVHYRAAESLLARARRSFSTAWEAQ